MRRLVPGLLACFVLAACPSLEVSPDSATAVTTTSTTADELTTTISTTADELITTGTTGAPTTESGSTTTGTSSTTTDGTTGSSTETTEGATGDPCTPGERSLVDRPDDVDGPQVHVVFARPSDQADRELDLDGSLAASVAVWNTWLAGQTGEAALRLDTCDGELDVTYLELPYTDAYIAAKDPYIRNLLEAELAAVGGIADDKLYAVYYDGSSTYSCGGGAWPPLIVGRVAALYLRGQVPNSPPCLQPFAGADEAPGYLEFAMLHEILHTLGLVATCAPHSDGAGHTNDTPEDLLYTGPEPWYPEFLDPGHDDYHQHGNPECPDLARSALLEPLPGSPELPYGW